MGGELELEAKLFQYNESRTVSFPIKAYILRFGRGNVMSDSAGDF